jgi:hypothetical protein
MDRDGGGISSMVYRGSATPETPPLSEGEIYYLWWFIQGSIMVPDIRWRLRRAWGLCGRHAWGALATEAAFRHGYLFGPAVLYLDIMERALRGFQVRGALQARRLARRLRATGPCLMCEMGFNAASRGSARPELIEEGRDPSYLLSIAAETRAYWRKAVCGRCVTNGASTRCRPHLVEEAALGTMRNLAGHRAVVKDIFEHLRVYKQSFVWGYHGTDTAEDRASLISAVGWCSGWHAWIDSFSFTKL